MNWPWKKRRPKNQDSGKIIVPAVQDRWTSHLARSYTPETVAIVLRSAMSGDLLAQWELFDLMEDTWPRLMKNLGELKRSVRRMPLVAQPWAEKGSDPSPEAHRKADLVEHLVWRMRPQPEADENGFGDTIRDILDAWGKGISVLEIDWERQETAQFGTVVAPKCTRWISPRYYGYPWDGAQLSLNSFEIDSAAGNITRSFLEQWQPFEPDKFLIAICKHKTGHAVSGALLRSLAFWWCASNFGAEWLLNYAQIFGQPIRWATYDPLQDGIFRKLCDALQNMGSAAWAAFPQGTQFELKEASKATGDLPQAYVIEKAETVCDVLILGQTLTTDAGDRGSQALGNVHAGIRSDVLEDAAEWTLSILNNQLIPAILRLNFGNDREAPWFMVESDDQKDAEAMARRDKILLEAGMELPKQWLHERHSVPLPAQGDEVVQRSMPKPLEQPVDLGKPVAAKSSQDGLIDRVMEDLTGVQARWLGNVRPFFAKLVLAAQDNQLSDEEFVHTLERAQGEIPELFGKMDTDALANALERATGTAVVNGAVAGYLKRRLQ